MLSIRPNVSTNYLKSYSSVPAFGEARRGAVSSEDRYEGSKITEDDLKNLSDEELLDKKFELEKQEYERESRKIRKQKEKLEEIADDDGIKVGKPIKKVVAGGSVVAGAILGGMATGWGAKKVWYSMSKLLKSAPVTKMKTAVKTFFTEVGKSIKTFKNNLAKKILKTDSKAPKKGFAKFIDNLKKSKIYKGIQTVGKSIKSGIKAVWNKIRGVKSEKVEKATTATLATSGGLASGYTAYKDGFKSDENDNDNED